ncbi:MAG: hypothetical protein IKA39_05885 [Clostridia bacterium]|nr:hypothetical protein [Clostridia bacterium]MBR2324396.1 hypothetical protein [Clostridia bacterium]
MAFSRELPPVEVGGAKSTIKITSDGWSGKVIHSNASDTEDRSFRLYFKFDYHNNYDTNLYGTMYGGTYPDSDNGGLVQYQGNDYIVGISLEHMGENLEGTVKHNQFLGMSGYNYAAAWGARPTDNAVTLLPDKIQIRNNFGDWQGVEFENLTTANIATLSNHNHAAFNHTVRSDGNWSARQVLEIDTDLPIFETDADLLQFCRSGGTNTSKILNIANPEEDYKTQFDYWFIYSTSGKNTRNVVSPSNVSDFLRFMPKDQNKDKICFLWHEPTKQEPWTLELHYYNSIPAYRSDSENGDYVITENVPWKYLDRSISFGSNDYYTSFRWLSNIPRADSLQQMEDYFNGVIDITEMSNYDQIARIDNSIIDPNFIGTNKDTETSLGTNGMQYGYGCRLYAITNIELAALFNELFDPLKLQDILDGQKIFGSDGITESIAGILYLPLSDLSDICGLGALSYIKIGSWQSENAQGRRINNNSGIIDVGSFTWTPTYNDFRDFEPYTMAFIETGFWGFHELQISKYYNKNVSCKVAIDCATGATSLMLFGDGILLDCFQGTCGASRPFVATDNNAYMNSIISAISGASSNASAGINNVGAAVADAGKLSTAGGAVGAAATGVGAVGVAGGIAASGIFAGYNIKNAVDSPPQISRGNLSGNLGYYANNKISFIIAQKRTIVPENREAVIGLPSGHGAPVGSFSGFLSCSAFKLADGFTGTDEERAEIMEIMRGGIYL